MVIFFDYAGTEEGRYRGIRPALMFVKKEFISSVNQVGYIKSRAATDTAGVIITEDHLDRLVTEILKEKDESGNLTDYGAYASKIEPSSLSNLTRTIHHRTPNVQINPLDQT